MDLVDHRGVVGRGPEVLADALDVVAVDRTAGVDRADRIHADDAHARSGHLAQVASRAADRAAGPDARHEMRERSVGVAPDLGAGGLVVASRAVRVGVLVRLEGAGDLADEPIRDGVVRARVVRLRRMSERRRPRRRRPAAPRACRRPPCRGPRTRSGSRAAGRRARGPRRCCRWSARRSCRRACSRPSRSAASMMLRAIRSLDEPPGLKYSTFASTVAAMPSVTRVSWTSGVLPTRSATLLA